mgnify:CR=1 FL=1|jgi:DNA invertase Pin-like site-specific DNA recombinase|tara:strand:- start:501 stop:722 length:222 start_codon:yes stop_codon:yes gene_type:complete
MNDYTQQVGGILTRIGRLALEQKKDMSRLLDLAEKNKDIAFISMLEEAFKATREKEEVMLKMIQALQRREDMR